MSNFTSCTSKGRAGNDQRSNGRTTAEHGIPARGGHHCTVEIVRVVLGQAVVMDDVGEDGQVGNRSSGILYLLGLASAIQKIVGYIHTLYGGSIKSRPGRPSSLPEA